MPETKSQRERFEKVARQLECDEDEAKFNVALEKIAKPPKSKVESRKKDE